jgi:AcrR family transcriptional regulator
MASRRRNAAATREAMLAAARRRFLEESYENVGLRDIAGDAGVDVALVGRYFGSKEELFHEVLRGTEHCWLDPAISAEELPAHLAALSIRKGEGDSREHLDRLLIILRSASSPQASELVRGSFREDVLTPIARVLDGPDGEMRAGVALSLLMGTTIIRTIMSVEPLSRCDSAALEARLRGLLEKALFG